MKEQHDVNTKDKWKAYGNKRVTMKECRRFKKNTIVQLTNENKEEKMEQKGIRLNKYLADCGVCSRRDADQLIEAGLVKVNGKPGVAGMKVSDQDEVSVRGKVLTNREKKVVLAYYKPSGVTCTEKDAHARVTIKDVLNYPVRVTYAGRLDKDSEGLLLMTNDGYLIQRAMKASEYHEKEYVVRVQEEITNDFLQQMRNGIYLKELSVTTRSCQVEQVGKYTFRIILTQGLNRQIRRMCKECGFHVKSLKRIRVMNVLLGDMKPGTYREVTGEELRVLYEQAGCTRHE